MSRSSPVPTNSPTPTPTNNTVLENPPSPNLTTPHIIPENSPISQTPHSSSPLTNTSSNSSPNSSANSSNSSTSSSTPSTTLRTHPMVTRSQHNIHKPIQKLILHTTTLTPSTPRSYTQAFRDPHWHAAMETEYNDLIKNEIWDLFHDHLELIWYVLCGYINANCMLMAHLIDTNPVWWLMGKANNLALIV